MTTLTGQQIADAGLEGWTKLAQALHTRIRTPDFASALALVNAIGAVAEELNHHPDLDLRWGRVDVRLVSHDAGGITQRDVELARRITQLAADAGHTQSRDDVAQLEVSLDSPEHTRIAPFWRAVLGLDSLPAQEGDDELRDPAGVLPNVWFQQSGSEEPRQRWHFDVWIDPAEVQPRIDAAMAAGGELVSDEAAPSFWVLADPEGNRMCFCTWQDRA